MNKNLIITALLVAVSCQSVSAAVPASMMSKAFTNVTSFAGSHKVALAATVGVSALLVAGYKYLTKEKVWVEGTRINFEKRNIFRKVIKKGFFDFKTPKAATDAYEFVKASRHGQPRLEAMAKVQRTSPNVVWNPRVMTDAEVQKLQQDVNTIFQEQDRIMRDAFRAVK